MCENTDLTDKIFTAWKAEDSEELARLRKETPQGFSICIVNPTHVHPTVVMVRDNEIESSVEGFYHKLDGTEARKRTLIADHRDG